MTSDRERYDIDWSSLTPAEAALVDEFAAALRQARDEETERVRLALYVLELLRDGVAELCAERSPHSPFWRQVEQRIGHASFFRPAAVVPEGERGNGPNFDPAQPASWQGPRQARSYRQQ